MPSVDIATASFPCVDLSLAGYRKGLEGEQSGLFFEFCRVLREMGERIPPAVLVENVFSFCVPAIEWLTAHALVPAARAMQSPVAMEAAV